MMCPRRTGKRRRIGVAWILLTSTTSVITATAFSLASIFPRKTEKVKPEEDLRNSVTTTSSRTQVFPFIHQETKGVAQDVGHTRRPESAREKPEQLPYQIMSDEPRQEEHRALDPNSTPKYDSVHLQLQTMHQPQPHTHLSDKPPEEQNTPPPPPPIQPTPLAPHSKSTQVRVLTFIDKSTNKTWVGLNTSRRKFLAFLECNNVLVPDVHQIAASTAVLPEQQTNESSDEAQCAIRSNWRDLWMAQQLITDRTELLAVYQSDNRKKLPQGQRQKRRGGFRDLMNLYANRLIAILQDERHDESTPLAVRYHSSLVRTHQLDRSGQTMTDETILQQTDHRILVKWLEDNYGMSETLMLQARRFRSLPVPAQLELMHHFLEWFRKHFPYYYDRCDVCGASQKDELSSQQHSQNAPESTNGDVDDDDDHSTFLGYIYPDEYEILGKASRTELYHCHSCGSFTRFPRYNSAFDIIQSRRGRCGEYSLLLYRFLRALNHDARWVVDWADHVWAEVLIGDNNTDHVDIGGAKSGLDNPSGGSPRWVHLDPCEAAVDKPLLYEEWGKKQTYIIALYAPLRYPALQVQNRSNSLFLGHLGKLTNGAAQALNGANFVDKISPLVEDVTQQYTSDSWDDISKRREESEEEVRAAIDDAIHDLENQLFR